MLRSKRETVADDAGGAVPRAADEAEAVGQQRQAAHDGCVVREGAQDLSLIHI